MANIELDATIEVVVGRYTELSEKAEGGNKNAVNELINIIQNSTFENYEMSKIRQELNDYLERDNSGENTIRGLPVEKDGKRLAFQNPNTNSIHIASKTPYENNNSHIAPGYTWSVCNFGFAYGKSQDNSMYLNPDEFDDEYITKDGDIIGKLCGNCRQTIN